MERLVKYKLFKLTTLKLLNTKIKLKLKTKLDWGKTGYKLKRDEINVRLELTHFN